MKKARKAVSLEVSIFGRGVVWAVLCNDGAMFHLTDDSEEWSRFPEIPQGNELKHCDPIPMPKYVKPPPPPPPPVKAPPVDIFREGEYQVNKPKPEPTGQIKVTSEYLQFKNSLARNREIMTKINVINQTLKLVTAIDSDDMSMTAVKRSIQNLLDNYGILSDA